MCKSLVLAQFQVCKTGDCWHGRQDRSAGEQLLDLISGTNSSRPASPAHGQLDTFDLNKVLRYF